jgi:hypothetical protein
MLEIAFLLHFLPGLLCGQEGKCIVVELEIAVEEMPISFCHHVFR